MFPRARLFDPEAIPTRQKKLACLVPVDVIIGACMLVRRDCWHRLGGFDERFFMYGEDADLCKRAARIGMRLGLVTDACYRHSVAASAHSRHEMICLLFRGQITYSRLHGGRMLRRTAGPILKLHAGLRLAAFTVAGLLHPAMRSGRVTWSMVWQERHDWKDGYVPD